MRRANGTGSVYKLSGNRRNPWVARVTVGFEEGRQLYKIIGFYPTKDKAEKAVALDSVMPLSDQSNITLKALFDQWKETRAYNDISRQTQQNYEAAFSKYMVDYHKKKFKDLRTPHFQNMIDKAATLGKSRSTMEKIKVLSGLLSNYALSQDIINKAYAQHVRLPKEAKKEIPIFTDMEIDRLFKNDTLPLVDTVLILIYTGMRIEELLSLTKFSVDIDNMIITGGIKTDAGKDRIVPVHTKIQKYIRARYDAAQNFLIEWDKPIGNKKKGTDTTIRSRYRYEYYCDEFFALLEKLGLNKPGEHRLTPHKARHTFFTKFTANCTDRKAIALIGGHTDPNFTDKQYVQPDIDRLKKAIETIK